MIGVNLAKVQDFVKLVFKDTNVKLVCLNVSWIKFAKLIFLFVHFEVLHQVLGVHHSFATFDRANYSTFYKLLDISLVGLLEKIIQTQYIFL